MLKLALTAINEANMQYSRKKNNLELQTRNQQADKSASPTANWG